MCEPVSMGIAIGAAVGATTSAITGRDPLMGALMGGVTGGFFPGGVGVGSIYPFAPGMVSAPLAGLAGVSVSLPGVLTAAGMGLAGGLAMNMLTPGTPEYTNYQQQLYAPNSQPSTVTGSGGKQAAYSLAESVRRAKKRKLTQEDVSDLSIDTSSFASEGLQFA